MLTSQLQGSFTPKCFPLNIHFPSFLLILCFLKKNSFKKNIQNNYISLSPDVKWLYIFILIENWIYHNARHNCQYDGELVLILFNLPLLYSSPEGPLLDNKFNLGAFWVGVQGWDFRLFEHRLFRLLEHRFLEQSFFIIFREE